MIKACGCHLIVERDAVTKERTEKGIIIPAAALRTPRFGPSGFATVISVGADVLDVRPGDRVCLKDVAGDDILWNGHTYTRLREKDLNGLVT